MPFQKPSWRKKWEETSPTLGLRLRIIELGPNERAQLPQGGRGRMQSAQGIAALVHPPFKKIPKRTDPVLQDGPADAVLCLLRPFVGIVFMWTLKCP